MILPMDELSSEVRVQRDDLRDDEREESSRDERL